MNSKWIRMLLFRACCMKCGQDMASSNIRGVGLFVVEPRAGQNQNLVARIATTCMSCGFTQEVTGTAPREPFRQLLSWLTIKADEELATGKPVSFPKGPGTRKPKKKVRVDESSRVHPSVRPGTPDIPITWDEQRRFMQMTSLKRSTKKFEKWIKRMTEPPSDPEPRPSVEIPF
jgi:hypothetical protein